MPYMYSGVGTWGLWVFLWVVKLALLLIAVLTVLFVLYKPLVEVENVIGTTVCTAVNRSPWSKYLLNNRMGWDVCTAYMEHQIPEPPAPPAPLPDPNLLKPVVRALIDGTNLPAGAQMHEHRLNLKRIGIAIQAMKLDRGEEIAVMVRQYNAAALAASDHLSGVAARHKVTLAQTRSTLESLAELLEPLQTPDSPSPLSPSQITRDSIRAHFLHISDDLDKLYIEAQKAQDALASCDTILWDLAEIAANESVRLNETRLALKTKETFVDWIKQINRNTSDVIVRDQVARAVAHMAAFSLQVDRAHVVVSGVMQAVTDYRKEVEAYSAGVAKVGIRQLPMEKQVSIIKSLLEELDGEPRDRGKPPPTEQQPPQRLLGST
ncbi:hypothetical protein HDV00_011088 [Rhizophlyctis rosea]|nr:hypothetical protein HDV00_011088 [Rhizophlyctis rosea]